MLKRLREFRLEKKLADSYDLISDIKFGVKTRGLVFVEELSGGTANHRFQHGYEPTPYILLQHLFDELKTLRVPKLGFIDYGCGKGRVVNFAMERGFGPVLGLEADFYLAQLARNNMFTKREQRYKIVRTFAEDFEIPNGQYVHFFFQPFGKDAFKEVLKKINLLNGTQYLVWVNPAYPDMLNDFGFEKLKTITHNWVKYKAIIWKKS